MIVLYKKDKAAFTGRLEKMSKGKLIEFATEINAKRFSFSTKENLIKSILIRMAEKKGIV